MSKKLLILLGVLLAVIAVYVAALNFGGEKDENDISFADFKAEDIQKLAWEYSGAEVVIERNEDSWSWTEDGDYPINLSKVEDMLSALTETKASTAIEDADGAEYGLDGTKPTVTVTLADGKEITVSVGDTNSIVNECYIKLSGDENIYLVDTSVKNVFERTIDDLLQTEDLPYISDADRITVKKGSESMSLEAKKSGKNSYEWSCDGVALDADKVDELKNGLNSIAWTECVDYKADGTELSEYGFAEPQAELSWGNGEESVEIEFGNSTDDGNIYARLKGSDMVYTVSDSVSEYFSTDPTEFAKQENEEETEETE